MPLAPSIIYIYTDLLNVPLLEENLDIMIEHIHRLNAYTQMSHVGVLNNASFRLNEDLGLVNVQYDGVQVLFASGSFSYRVLKFIFLCSVLSSVRNVFIHSDLLIYFSKDDSGFSL